MRDSGYGWFGRERKKKLVLAQKIRDCEKRMYPYLDPAVLALEYIRCTLKRGTKYVQEPLPNAPNVTGTEASP